MPQKRRGQKGKRGSASRQEPMAKKAGAGKELSIADVDFNNPAERDAYVKQLQRKAGENVHAAVKRLKELGIIDEHGNRINKTLPPEMQPGSRCQVTK